MEVFLLLVKLVYWCHSVLTMESYQESCERVVRIMAASGYAFASSLVKMAAG